MSAGSCWDTLSIGWQLPNASTPRRHYEQFQHDECNLARRAPDAPAILHAIIMPGRTHTLSRTFYCPQIHCNFYRSLAAFPKP